MYDVNSDRRVGAERWVRAISQSFGPSVGETTLIEGLDYAIHTLQPFTGEGINHAFLPDGGGLDVYSVGKAQEGGLLYFSCGGLGEIFKPRTIQFEYIPERPAESFFLITIDQLNPVRINGEASSMIGSRQELLLLPDGSYHERWHVDAGHMGHDEFENEIPLPSGSQVVSRWIAGQILLVPKFGAWNSVGGTYDGRHNRMTASQIRTAVLRNQI